MYKLIIIDDEPEYLETILSIFDWSSLGYEYPHTFNNSSDAISYLEHNKVDAILTDIQMPVYTGIDIARICHEKYPHIKTAFLTAYSDFEYAKSAIKYNVTDYIIKGSSFIELSATIEDFLLSVSSSSATDSPPSTPDDIEKFKKQQLFSNLLLGMVHSETELKKGLASVGLSDINISLPCCILTFILEDFNDYLQHWKHSREQLYLAIEQMVLSENSSVAFYITRYAHDKLEFIVMCHHNCSDFEQALSKNLNILIQNANSLLGLKIRQINRLDFKSMTKLINGQEIQFGTDPVNPDSILEKARQYIRDNYNKNISLNEIAAHVALSPTYFSSYYKKVSKSNFNSDLNKYRIEKAKEILANTDTKASQVFHMIGYQSYTYFYKIFKEYTGMTPANYQMQFMKKK